MKKNKKTPKSNRKKLTILIITLVVLLLSLGISYAYFSDVFNTFNTKSELVYTISSSDGGTSDPGYFKG